ncbi:hypothetical protein CDL15_Pgr008072 [Punica granatum]|uniref:Uncharacterized protein n=1 Tax=Punica granatum TaxID=22663 RepID=A0A218WPK5_PUNGR|nr:hypothetical protein CDL15_Pgr008072 [Punica granatum]
MAKEHQPAISEDDTSRILTYSQLSTTHAPPPPPISAGAPTAYSGAPLVHLPPPTTRTTSNFGDSARIIALESMVNQLATNMATNMTELMALLRDQNRASSSYIPPPGQRSMVDPNLVVPLTFVSESEEAPMGDDCTSRPPWVTSTMKTGAFVFNARLRPPQTSSTRDEYFQATYTGASPVEARASTTSASDIHWGLPG